MAYSRDDVQPPYAGGPTPGRRHLLTPRDFEVLDYNESLLTPPETVSSIRVDGIRWVAESTSTIQLARDRLRRSIDETSGVNRADSIITPRGRLQARPRAKSLYTKKTSLGDHSSKAEQSGIVPLKATALKRWRQTY